MTVFAAASLTEPFDELEQVFEDAYPGIDIVINYGGSSGLADADRRRRHPPTCSPRRARRP